MITITSFTATPVMDTAYGNIAMNPTNMTEDYIAYLDTELAVRKYFSDVPVMVQIARCESQFRHTLADGSILQGRIDGADTGVMQINKRYHAQRAAKLGLDLNNLFENMQYARILYEEKGTQPWNASAPCWERTIAMQ